MNIRPILCGLAASQMFWAPSALGQNDEVVLWSNVKAGMAVQEVLKALPGAALSDDGKTVVAATQIAGQPMRTYVEFLAGRAAKVSLAGSGVASDVRTGLSAKYGDPVRPVSCSSISRTISICVETWMAPSNVKVTLTRLNGPNGTGIKVDYEAIDTKNL